MRTRILLICAVLFALCMLVLLRRAPKHAKSVPTETGVTLSNQKSGDHPTQLQHSGEPESPGVLATPGLSAAVPAPWLASEETNPHKAQLLALWQGPIDFYGRVVDEHSNAVTSASVQFRWTETPTEDGERTSATESDSEGLFSLHGKVGRSLTVWANKEGYHSSHGCQQTFLYGALDPRFSPDQNAPVIFNLKKRGVAENLTVVKQSYSVPRDGTPVEIDLATGKANGGSGGNLVVQCWTDDGGKRAGQKYDWRCRITIPGGGVSISDKELDFVAPDNGYVGSAEIAMPADRADWKDDIGLKFFYQLRDGRYGRMTFYMVAGGQHFCIIESFLNPSGSRNLEFAPKKANRPAQ